MYEPIGHLISGEMRIEVENGICKAIKDMGIVVDKEELIKALQYDRGQYDKGYMDGYSDASDHRMPKKPIPDDDGWVMCPDCRGSLESSIEEAQNGETSYCYHCGQAIDWSVDDENAP